MSARPPPHAGLRHVALWVADHAACERFYVELLAMAVEWRPDADTVYLSSGPDNLALHRGSAPSADAGQRLAHIGFIIPAPEQVDQWHAWLVAQGVSVLGAPRTHRDGARSFYCLDPAGNRVQILYHPPLAGAPGE